MGLEIVSAKVLLLHLYLVLHLQMYMYVKLYSSAGGKSHGQ